ncbi:MAG: c-type cytochrome biogenesis protein CcmI, partial [Sideroxydans sp.]
MTAFWIICAVLLFIAVPFIVFPLWRGTVKSNTIARDAANLEILRDQINEMDVDLKNGLLSADLHEQGRSELQSRVLEEVGDATSDQVETAHSRYKILAIVLSVLLPVFAVGVYTQVGNLDAFSDRAAHAGMSDVGAVGGSASISALEQKVEANPADGESILLLARAYMEAERFADSAKAYENLTQYISDEAWIWADYADALAMAQNQSLRGKPTELINKALSLDPNSMKGLALAGSAGMERG